MRPYRCAMILCAGSGERANLGYNKVFFFLGQKSVIETVMDKFSHFDKIVLVASGLEIGLLQREYSHIATITEGGATRSQSVRNGLKMAHGCDIVTIHDGARPFVTRKIIDDSVSSAVEFGSGIAAIRIVDSIKKADGNIISDTLNRSELYAAQTPQSFRYSEILHAYNSVSGSFEDDSEVYRMAGFNPVIINGSFDNKKLTNHGDFLPCLNRIGTGFDVHCLTKNRDLIIGGVKIPYELGLEGHSDADVLLHAITDALLSAAGQGDIGTLFPDSDSQYKDIDSMILLKKASGLLDNKPEYISAVIIAQQPKMSPYIKQMQQKIAECLEIDDKKVNISATTTEFMGVIGNGEAIAAGAVCLINHD